MDKEFVRENLLSLSDVAKHLDISYRTVIRRMKYRNFPLPLEWGDNTKLWWRKDVEEYAEKNKKRSGRLGGYRERSKSDIDIIREMLEGN